MKEQFDRKLIEKIKVSFENHEEPFDPREWEKLSHAYFHPAKKKKFAYWPFLVSGIAASLLLLFMFWPIGEDLQKNVRAIADSITLEGKQFEKIELPVQKDKKSLALADQAVRSTKPGITPAEPEAYSTEPRKTVEPIHSRSLSQTEQTLTPLSRPLDRPNVMENIDKTASENSMLAQNNNSEYAQQYLEQWKAEGQGTAAVTKKKSNNVRLGVLVGPQTSSHPVSGMSLGAGVMSEFSITDRLKVDIGVTYASHSMVPETSMPGGMTMDMDSPQSEMIQSLSSSPRYIGSDAELNFSGLDIPVNLKYKVMDKEKSGLFLITGLSSMVYLNQQTVETMAVNSYFNSTSDGQLEFQRSVQQFTHEAGPEKSGDGVDLGRMLNLSIGYEYNLKNGTFLSIEPYYKMPLGDMTFANQQFSLGGLNLRMNFRLGK